MKTGMIGLGAMGENMAHRIGQGGYLVGVYNRTVGKAQTLADKLNVKAYQSPEAMAAEVDLILICVSADRDVLEIVNAICLSVKSGTIVIDISTVSSETAQIAASLLEQKQARFLDAPVSGGVEGAKKGKLAMMVGGDAEVLATATPVLACMAASITHMGGIGAGQATKAVNQIMAAGINQAVREALAFAQAQQLPMEKIIEVISAGAAGNWFLQHRGLTMTQGNFKPGFKVALHRKDLAICKKMAEALEINLPLTLTTLKDYEALMEQGYGNEDISSLFRLKSKT